MVYICVWRYILIFCVKMLGRKITNCWNFFLEFWINSGEIYGQSLICDVYSYLARQKKYWNKDVCENSSLGTQAHPSCLLRWAWLPPLQTQLQLQHLWMFPASTELNISTYLGCARATGSALHTYILASLLCNIENVISKETCKSPIPFNINFWDRNYFMWYKLVVKQYILS